MQRGRPEGGLNELCGRMLVAQRGSWLWPKKLSVNPSQFSDRLGKEDVILERIRRGQCVEQFETLRQRPFPRIEKCCPCPPVGRRRFRSSPAHRRHKHAREPFH